MPHHELLVRGVVLKPKLKGVVRGAVSRHASPSAEQQLMEGEMLRIAKDDRVRGIMRRCVPGVGLSRRGRGDHGKAKHGHQGSHTSLAVYRFELTERWQARARVT